ncbi:MAG: glycosyltransferase family 2 protein [Bacteroidaceae bacterium]|nr:glycosyltransferase family 2 protein [Bacteroidaceae bacterium]
MLDISVIILTYNEELHIRRCLENICTFAKKVYVIDSPSTDKTVEVCKEFPNVEVVVHKYPGNQAEQFNWALDNVQIDTEWVLRLDADEYLTTDLKIEMEEKLPTLSSNVSAIVFSLGRAFMGRILKHGIVNGVKMIRLFRYGKVRYEQRLMDEHLQVLDGDTVTFEHKFVDDNRNSLKYFVDKHNNYSSREAALLLDAEYGLIDYTTESYTAEYCEEIQAKRAQKQKYAKMPLFWRSFGYFCYRYFIKFGFLDGKEGFLWDFLQGWWYRTLVDAKIYEIKQACGNDKEKIKEYLFRNYNIIL